MIETLLGLSLLTLSWDKNWDSHSLVNVYPSFYPRIALVAPSPGGYPSWNVNPIQGSSMVTSSVRYPSIQWRHNEHASVSNHQRLHCLLNCRFRHRSKETSKLRVTGLCVGNSPATGEFPAQKASNAENVYIWWRHHVKTMLGGNIQKRCVIVDTVAYIQCVLWSFMLIRLIQCDIQQRTVIRISNSMLCLRWQIRLLISRISFL